MAASFRVVVALLAAALALLTSQAPRIVDAAVRVLMSYPLDVEIGNAELADAATLAARLEGKRALVVGGTRGIGRGVALTFARAGCDVHVVGRSQTAGAAVVSSMQAVSSRKVQHHFKASSHDLSTIAGCEQLVQELQQDGLPFDLVVFTVGVWPDLANPQTPNGINKVVALDVVARFLVLNGIRAQLNHEARILNVLASTFKLPTPSTQSLKGIISGEVYNPNFWALPSASIAADALLFHSARKFPSVKLIGVHPGFVKTELPASTFPVWVAEILKALMTPFAVSEDTIGATLASIISSPNVERRDVSYFNYLLEGRQTHPLAYDNATGTWLMEFLDGLSKNATA
eukprot:TRINITY_DN48145_c0_g1_i1.p1 TRINITY_DN48145_c0_g1~~TRINITY_DN48145_c0_g1_i1.p1  ORF type:complete len:346 (+),score=52.26 TRINITY_DN48145_c0_g1_i1:86-1123(+)